MSKSELKEEKKRKRQEEGAEEVPKKSKKSKKVKEVAAEEVPLDDVAKKEKKEKKTKKSKKGGDEAETNGTTEHEQDFIKLEGGDEPMTGVQNGTISREDGKKSKKDKKDKKDKKEKKSKKNEVDEDAMEVEATSNAPVKEAEPAAELSKEEKKKAKKEKKEKKSKKNEENADAMDLDAAAEAEPSRADKKKSKKEKKAIKSEKETKTEAEQYTAVTAEESVANGDVEKDLQDQEEDAPGKKSRFIVFVGNLPFSATKESIEAHFAKLKPFEIRMRFYKDNKKFMGTCFIEFDRYDHMQTALTKYHHSVFPDEKLKDGRKINVELSAGGGGNNPARQEKIKAKNEKLANERHRIRERREEIESKQKERKEKKEARGIKTTDGAADEPKAEAGTNLEDENTGIHPARLAMMQEKPKPWQQNGGGGGRGGGRPWQQNHRQRF